MPIVLTVFVWPHTAGEGSSTGTWFHWVKVYSALAGCLILWELGILNLGRIISIF